MMLSVASMATVSSSETMGGGEGRGEVVETRLVGGMSVFSITVLLVSVMISNSLLLRMWSSSTSSWSGSLLIPLILIISVSSGVEGGVLSICKLVFLFVVVTVLLNPGFLV